MNFFICPDDDLEHVEDEDEDQTNTEQVEQHDENPGTEC